MLTAIERVRAWRNVLFALVLREFQSTFNDKLGLSWAFVEPFLFIVVLAFLRSIITGSDVHSVPIFVFMMLGLMGIQLFTSTMNDVAGAIKRNKPLYALRQVLPIGSVLAVGFKELLVRIGVVILIALAIYFTGQEFSLFDPLLLIGLFFSLWLLAISAGLLFAVAASFVPETDKVRRFVTRPLFFISGVFFSLQDIPPQYWHYLTWNPILHYIELARYACYESYGNLGVSPHYAFGSSLVLFCAAMAVYHISWKKLLN